MKTKNLFLAFSLLMGTNALASDLDRFFAFDMFNHVIKEKEHFDVKMKKAHKVILLNHGLASLEERLQMIERAKKTIDVEYFIYRTDKSAKLFTQALVKKARQGVKVRMLLDYFMIKSDLSPFYAHELEEAGIQVKYFNTTSTLNLFSGQYRNHRKLLLVDGKEIITGGRNIGDEYFDLHEEYNFLDREMHIEGDMVDSMQRTFDETFSADMSKRVARAKEPNFWDAKYSMSDRSDTNQYDQDLASWTKKAKLARDFVNAPMKEELEKEIRRKGQEELQREYRGTCNNISFMSEYPNLGKKNRKESRIIKHHLFERIAGAKSSILIDSPYFIVNNELSDSLNSALEKKVDVTLLTNSLNSTDAIYVYANFDSNIKEWLKKGLDSYIFKGDRPQSYEVIASEAGSARFGVHAKTFIFDDKDVIIGTYNVDPRSANYNSEMIVGCENSPELAMEVKKDIQLRIDESIHLDSVKAVAEAEFHQTNFGKKILYYLTKGPANLFEYLL